MLTTVDGTCFAMKSGTKTYATYIIVYRCMYCMCYNPWNALTLIHLLRSVPPLVFSVTRIVLGTSSRRCRLKKCFFYSPTRVSHDPRPSCYAKQKTVSLTEIRFPGKFDFLEYLNSEPLFLQICIYKFTHLHGTACVFKKSDMLFQTIVFLRWRCNGPLNQSKVGENTASSTPLSIASICVYRHV